MYIVGHSADPLFQAAPLWGTHYSFDGHVQGATTAMVPGLMPDQSLINHLMEWAFITDCLSILYNGQEQGCTQGANLNTHKALHSCTHIIVQALALALLVARFKTSYSSHIFHAHEPDMNGHDQGIQQRHPVHTHWQP